MARKREPLVVNGMTVKLDAPGPVGQRATIIFSYTSDLPRLARMQRCHVEVEGAVTHHSPAEAWPAP
jgi:hypothetical protein